MTKILAVSICLLLGQAYADSFDRLTNPEIARLIGSDSLAPVEQVTAAQLNVSAGRLHGFPGALLILQTREGRWAKLLVQPGLQKIGDQAHPMILIERFVTLKGGTERTITARGGPVQLFAGVTLNADLGQVVPPTVGGDLEAVASPDGKSVLLKVAPPARLYLLVKPLDIPGPKSDMFAPGESFEPRFITGRYRLAEDGRRFGELSLNVDESSGEVTGAFTSDKDGRRYDVAGKLGAIRHQLQFTIKFPMAEQVFSGFAFTGNGRAIAGTAKMRDRESGFYAIRDEEAKP